MAGFGHSCVAALQQSGQIKATLAQEVVLTTSE